MTYGFRLEVAWDTHLGMKRSNNEDFVEGFQPDSLDELLASGCLFIVADGVGGAEAGEIASKHATRKVLFDYYQYPEMHPGERLAAVMRQAGNEIYDYAKYRSKPIRMATTMVAAVVHEQTLTVAHVGDSRAYLIRAGNVQQLTQDHSVVGEMVRNGVITEQEADASNLKNRLNRSLGGEKDVMVDIANFPLAQGDKVLLCSDGLSRYSTNQDLARLTAAGAPAEIVDRLIHYGNQCGGADNIAALILSIGEPIILEDGFQELEDTLVDRPIELMETEPLPTDLPFKRPSFPPPPTTLPALRGLGRPGTPGRELEHKKLSTIIGTAALICLLGLALIPAGGFLLKAIGSVGTVADAFSKMPAIQVEVMEETSEQEVVVLAPTATFAALPSSTAILEVVPPSFTVTLMPMATATSEVTPSLILTPVLDATTPIIPTAILVLTDTPVVLNDCRYTVKSGDKIYIILGKLFPQKEVYNFFTVYISSVYCVSGGCRWNPSDPDTIEPGWILIFPDVNPDNCMNADGEIEE